MDALHTISWDWIKSFVAVSEHGSVLAAAQHLLINPATVSRQIGFLEKALGSELFIRSRQGMQPTLAAMQFLLPAQAMHEAMHKLSLSVAAKDDQLTGKVRISVSLSLAHFILPDLLDVLRNQQPGLHFEITATDAISNISKREADIAIRLVQPQQQELIAKRVAYFAIGLYASHRYLSRRGIPKLEAASLMQHDFVDVAPAMPIREGFRKAGILDIESRIACTASDHANAWQMVRGGLGIGSSFTAVAKRDPLVTQVLSETPIGRFPVWLVTHRELRTQPRLRIVMDYLAQALKSLGS